MASLAPEVDLDNRTSGVRLSCVVEMFDPRWADRNCVPKLIYSNGTDMEHVRTAAHFTAHQVVIGTFLESHRRADRIASTLLFILFKPAQPDPKRVRVSVVLGRIRSRIGRYRFGVSYGPLHHVASRVTPHDVNARRPAEMVAFFISKFIGGGPKGKVLFETRKALRKRLLFHAASIRDEPSKSI